MQNNNESEIKYELNLIVQKGSNYISLFLPPPPSNNLDLFTLSREELFQPSDFQRAENFTPIIILIESCNDIYYGMNLVEKWGKLSNKK